jgi:putative transposase
MPTKNSRKIYRENSYYHVYNRSIDRRIIFTSAREHRYFLHLLSRYLTPPKSGLLPDNKYSRYKLFEEIQVLCYCLMPNHAHLLLYQKSSRSTPQLLQKVFTAYSQWFNLRHQRQGSLFEGRYKAVLIETDEQLIHTSRYIHRNPHKNNPCLEKYPYSSLSYYLDRQKPKPAWLHTHRILDYFSPTNHEVKYANFVYEVDEGTWSLTL